MLYRSRSVCREGCEMIRRMLAEFASYMQMMRAAATQVMRLLLLLGIDGVD